MLFDEYACYTGLAEGNKKLEGLQTAKSRDFGGGGGEVGAASDGTAGREAGVIGIPAGGALTTMVCVLPKWAGFSLGKFLFRSVTEVWAGAVASDATVLKLEMDAAVPDLRAISHPSTAPQMLADGFHGPGNLRNCLYGNDFTNTLVVVKVAR